MIDLPIPFRPRGSVVFNYSSAFGYGPNLQANQGPTFARATVADYVAAGLATNEGQTIRIVETGDERAVETGDVRVTEL